jgi:hypothetical protein
VRRDDSAPISVPVDDGQSRLRRSSAREATRGAEAPYGSAVAAEVPRESATAAPTAREAAPTEVATTPLDDADAAERIRHGDVQVETVQVHRPGLGKRERRGVMIAGALGLPLVTLGLITLAVPIGAWYVTSVFKSVIMAVAALFASEARVREIDASITQVDPTSFGNGSFWLIVAGAVLLLAGLLLSWLVMRAHGVFHPMLVTLTAVPMAIGLSFILQAGAGALAGLVFRLGDGGVSAVVANALFALLLFVVASVVIAVVVGMLVWLWMGSVFRATVVTGVPGSATTLAGSNG